jgi:hypothetical protein
VAYHAHDISRLLLGQKVGARLHDAAVGVLGFPARQAANGNAGRVSSHHLGGALSPQIEIEAALYDAEEILLLGLLVGVDAAVEPADGALHGLLHAGVVGRGGGNHVVELHHDVGADGVLQGDGVLGREQHGRAVVGAQEAHALLRHLCKLEQRHHLEAGRGVSTRAVVGQERGMTDPPLSALVSLSRRRAAGARGAEAGTCEHVVRPRLQLVRAAYGIEGGLSGLEAAPPCQLRSTPRSSARLQVVCVVETEAAALVGQLVRREALERRLRGHGHEDGQRHRPVGQMQRCSARFRDLAASDGRMAGWKWRASNIQNICPAAQTRAPTASEQAPWWFV